MARSFADRLAALEALASEDMLYDDAPIEVVYEPFPLVQLRQALADLDSGMLHVRGYQPGGCTIHIAWVHYGAYMTPWPAYYQPLCRALDERGVYVNTAAELRELLVRAINEQTYAAP